MLPSLDHPQLPPNCRVFVVPETEQRPTNNTLFADLPEVMTTQTAADALGCCDRMVRKMLSEGTVSGFKLGSSWRVTKKNLIAFVEGGGCRG